MKRLILFILFALMHVMMFVFAMAGIGTIEWCTDRGIPIPGQAYALLIIVGVWCIMTIGVTQRNWKVVDRFFTKLTGESKDEQSK